ncbi:hypothetical protein FAI41_04680 [Acetobacteraceae bacterium]|nr:hypothetical protein FAI41_04680 [Acetobacteraceae bacterium]
MVNNNLFTGLGISVGATNAEEGQIIPFQPNPNTAPPFSFMSQIAEGQIQVNILWNLVGQRYWMQVKNANGNFLICRPLTATPSMASKGKIDLLNGTSQSKIYFYEDTQSFQIIL